MNFREQWLIFGESFVIATIGCFENNIIVLALIVENIHISDRFRLHPAVKLNSVI